MTRIKLLIVILFLVALGTGFLVGMGVARSNASATGGGGKPVATTNPRNTRPSLTEALSLTPQQSEQLKTIWTDWDPTRQARTEKHQQYQKERDDAVQALLTEQQKTAFEAVQKSYHEKMDLLDAERQASFKVAVEKTKAILTDLQKSKYEEILKNGPPGRGPRGGWGDRRGPSSRPATQPTTAPG